MVLTTSTTTIFSPRNSLVTKQGIVFIDSALDNYQQLKDGVLKGLEAVLLNPLQDGIAQITEILACQSQLKSIHFIAHGEPGNIQFGQKKLNLANLGQYSDNIAIWAESLAPDGEILIYGCNVAANHIGKTFVEQLARITGVQVAASTKPVGNGNWKLDFQTGAITSSLAFSEEILANYQGIFPVGPNTERYVADTNAYESIDLIPGAAGVVTIPGLTSTDNNSVAIDLGTNSFRFYGTNYTGLDQLFISENGLISFGSADSNPYNDDLSYPYRPRSIAVLWDDWVTNRNTSPDDLVLYQFQDLNNDSINDRLVIEWNNIYNYNGASTSDVTFQAILSLNTGSANGDIVFNYKDLDTGDPAYDNGNSATIGLAGADRPRLLIGQDGNSALPISNNTAISITTSPIPFSNPPTLFKDINTVSYPSYPQSLVNFNASLYFVADDGVHGYELWKSDGTATGTNLVTDLYLGSDWGLNGYGVYPELTVVNNQLYFIGYDGNYTTSDNQLWKTDGTEAGTVKVKDFPSHYSDPYYLTNVNGTLFFSAYDDTNGREIWKSDGTVAGTVLVKNIEGGIGDSNPENLTDVNGTMYFTAYNSSSGRELWKSNGTSAGTVLVKNIAAAADSSNPANLTNLNGTLFFTAYDGSFGTELWKSDGTSGGTVRVKDIASGGNSASPSNLTILNSQLYFFAYDALNGTQLWKTDGTNANTVRVSNTLFYPQSNSIAVNGLLYFFNNGNINDELWKSDGTEAGTVKIADLPYYYSISDDLTEVNGILYFTSYDDTNGRELWKSDGTAAGTVLVEDIVPGVNESNSPYSSSPSQLTAVGNNLYFSANTDAGGSELWKSDGTVAGTVSLDVNAFNYGSALQDTFLFNGSLYFTADDGVHGWELWKSDGTEAGTTLFKDLYPGGNWGVYSQYASSEPEFTIVNNQLYFVGYDGNYTTSYNQLWKTDGTEAGTVKVKDFPSYYSYPQHLTNVNGTLFFSAYDDTAGREIWKSDGTSAGTVRVKNIESGIGDSNPENLTDVNGTLYFTAYTSTYGSELWKSNGTSTGTVLVKNIAASADSSNPANLTNLNGTLFFTAYDGSFGTELWKTDGTSAGTVRVKDIASGAGSSSPGDLNIINNQLYFFANDNVNGYQLWKSDGTNANTVRVSDTVFNGSGQVININNTLFFFNDNDLWKSDGTAAGTTKIIELDSDFYLYNNELKNINGTLYFTAYEPEHGWEVWKSDGTAVGTYRVTDVNPGAADSNPSNLIYFNNSVYFKADDGLHGKELWQLSLNLPPTDLSLSNTNIDENVAANTVVGAFSSTDPDAGNTFTYSLVTGTGDTDNSAFTIVNNQLQIKNSPNFESKSSYSVRVRTTDQGGLSFEKAVTVNVNNLNEAPTNIALSPSSVNENVAGNTVVGIFNTTDPDTGNTFTYSLVTGTGDTDNSAFTIVNNQLQIKNSPNFESKSSYSIRVQTTDQSGLTFEKAITVNVNDLNEAPTNIALSPSSVNENVAANTVVGTFNTTDPDTGNTFTYQLVTGTATNDNSSFTIVGNQLLLKNSPNFEAKPSYTIRVRSTDQNGLSFTRSLVVNVNDLNEKPTNINLSATSIDENVAANTVVGTFSTIDPDAGNTFTYSFTTGTGSTDNSAFSIVGDQLLIKNSPDFETKSSYSILVRSRDQGTLAFNKVFTISVNDLFEGVSGTSGDDIFNATPQIDAIQGLEGNDTFNVAITNLQSGDNFDGGVGVDTLNISGGSSTQTLEFDLNNPNQFSNSNLVGLTNVTIAGFENLNLSNFAGNAVMTGNNSDNQLTGSAGDTVYRFLANTSLGTDTIAETSSGGNDTLNFGGTTSAVKVNLGITTVQTINSNLKLSLSASDVIENVTGGEGSDRLTGNSLKNILIGDDGDDQLQGLGGKDTLWGGGGNDILTGGLGDDRYRFQDSAAFTTNLGVDYITQFEAGQDLILLSKTTFTAISDSVGQPLTDFAVVSDDALVDSNAAHIVYSQSTGSLFYNRNGSGINSSSVFEFANLGNLDITLSSSDFSLIA